MPLAWENPKLDLCAKVLETVIVVAPIRRPRG